MVRIGRGPQEPESARHVFYLKAIVITESPVRGDIKRETVADLAICSIVLKYHSISGDEPAEDLKVITNEWSW